MIINIAIDGPCGAGKSTVAKYLAKRLQYVYLDTGAMYRCLALKALRNHTDISDSSAVDALLQSTSININYENGNQTVYLDEVDVSADIREHEVSKMASDISAIPAVRVHMASMQRTIAEKQNCVLDGRDIGTYVLPNAQVKFYLTAKDTVRAQRRCAELSAKGQDISFEQVLSDVRERDYNDIHRELAPLAKAKDAVVIDSSDITIEHVVSKMVKVFKKKTTRTKHLWHFAKFIRHPLKLVYPVKVFNLERIQDKRTVIVSNHSSGWDPIILQLWCNVRLHFMYKSQFDKSKLLKTILYHLEQVSVRRGTPDIVAIKKCINLLEEDKVFGLFPEGTRNKVPDTLQEFKTGAAVIALRTHSPILPVYTFDRYKPFHKNYILVGEEFELTEFYGKNQTKQVLTAATAYIKEKLDQTRIQLNEILEAKGVKRRKRSKKEQKEMEIFLQNKAKREQLQKEKRIKEALAAGLVSEDENFEIARLLSETSTPKDE